MFATGRGTTGQPRQTGDDPPARSPPARRGLPRAGRPIDPRFSLANERTFLAWNRTALTLIGGGLAAAQLLRFGLSGLRELVSLPLIALGAVFGVVGLTRWRANEAAMRIRADLPEAGPHPATYTILNFPVEVIARAVDELAARGVHIERFVGFEHDERGVFRGGGSYIDWFKDPAGNLLSVLQER